MMRTRTLLLAIGLCTIHTLAWGQEVYKGEDEQGNPVYSDTPPKEGGQKLKLPPTNILDNSPSLKIDIPAPDTTGPADQFKYHRLEITAPQNNETVFIRTTNMPIELKLIPALNQEAGHTLEILLDGKVLAKNQQRYLLSDANRGSHEIRAHVLDSDGEPLVTSESVTVHIKKPTVNQPAP